MRFLRSFSIDKKDKPAFSPHQIQPQKKERTDSNTWHNFKWSEAKQVEELNINGAKRWSFEQVHIMVQQRKETRRAKTR